MQLVIITNFIFSNETSEVTKVNYKHGICLSDVKLVTSRIQKLVSG